MAGKDHPMEFNDQPESMQHTMTSAEDLTEKRQIFRPTLPVQQTVLVIPEHERKSYPTDLTDVHWQRIAPLLPPTTPNGHQHKVEPREVVNGILYVVSGSHDWRSFPPDLPPRGTVYSYFRRWQRDGTLKRIIDALCSEECGVADHEEPLGAAPGNAVSGETVFGGLLSEEDDISDIAHLTGAQGARILHRSPNFFVLAPSYRNSQLVSRVTPQVASDSHPAIHQELAVTVLDAPESHRPAPLLRASTWRIPIWLETIMVTVGLAASFATHAINMFNYPRYELDEGTYMSSAWAIMNGMITPYPYGYGHPPLAWIQIAGWVQLTGGFFTFGNAINSGRVLMLLFALGCSLLVYLIARQISTSRSAGLLAMVLFSLSPISLTYQRQVFLDNVGTFWLLLSLYLIIASKSRLSYIVSAALSFGIAILSKEIFLLFMPVLICAVWLESTRYQRKFTIIAFTYIVVACGLAFVLLAVLKGELFPYSWHLPWDHHPHLSMLDTFIQQAQRGQVQGKFSDAWYQWTHTDRLLMEVGLIAVAFNLLVGVWKNKHLLWLLPPFRFFKRWRVRGAVPVWDRHLLLALLAISFWLLLVRGGVVLTFYIIPMIPLLALNITAAISLIVTLIVRFKPVCALLIFAMIGVLAPYDLQHAQPAFTLHPTSAQRGAVVWVRNNVPSSAMIVINSYLYMDLREPGGQGVGGGAVYPYAHVYWNVAYDPELYTLLLQGNWDRIDYIVADSEMLHDIETTGGPMKLIYTALQHSILRAEFRANDSDGQIVISIYQVIHSNAPPEA
jgi:4-amino-4-deoxy-L-arabinose transferase-like glycosyltransferase